VLEHLDLTSLEALLVENEAAYLRQRLNETWGYSIELNGRIGVL
jgi:hypothetical protein